MVRVHDDFITFSQAFSHATDTSINRNQREEWGWALVVVVVRQLYLNPTMQTVLITIKVLNDISSEDKV
jgi:hypothetical protein